MWKALLIEIKNTIFKSFFHFLRFSGLLIVPFIYGFSYIYAFYDPFEKVSEAKVTIITEKGDLLGEAIAKELSKENEMKMGDVNMTMKMDHIYSTDNLKDARDNSYAMLQIGSTNLIEDEIIKTISSISSVPTNDEVLKLVSTITNSLSPQNSPDNKALINFTLNYKKNYLLAFGINAGAEMYSSVQFVEKIILAALNDRSYIWHLAEKITGIYGDEYIQIHDPVFGAEYLKIGSIFTAIKNNGISNINPVNVEAHMGDHAKYGYGLAPFFISVAMWVGGMVMTFAIHRKIYNKKVTAGHRYLAKWLLMVGGVVIQATVLMVGLHLIGFKDLGLNHWGSLYIGAIISGIVFSSIIQAIRFSIHDRTIGIILTMMLLVFQMASGGGLFPVETQAGFYRIINKIVPMSRTINILRELAFDTNWSAVVINFGYLSIWLFIIPIGILINHKRTVKIYKQQNWLLPPSMAYRENIKKEKSITKYNKKGGK